MNADSNSNIAKSPLHVIWLVDCSGSMSGERINMINEAIWKMVRKSPQIRTSAFEALAKKYPNIEVLLRVVKFSTGTQWHIATPTPLTALQWPLLEASGLTDLGAALTMIAKELRASDMPYCGMPIVLILMTDGLPTDDFQGGLNALLDLPMTKKTANFAIAIGDEANEETLRQFLGSTRLVQAYQQQQFEQALKTILTAVMSAASKVASRIAAEQAASAPEPRMK